MQSVVDSAIARAENLGHANSDNAHQQTGEHGKQVHVHALGLAHAVAHRGRELREPGREIAANHAHQCIHDQLGVIG